MSAPSNAKKENVAYEGIPEWVLNEPEKYQPVFMARLFDWALFGQPVGYTAKEYFTGHSDWWTDKDTEYVYRRFVEEGYIASQDAGERYVWVDHGWPIEKERTVLRRVNDGAPEWYDYSVGAWVEDWNKWYSYVINDNCNEQIGKHLAEAIIREHGGRL